MNKTKKIFIMLIIIYTICATFLTSFAGNCTNRDGKGTVTVLSETPDGNTLDEGTWGTAENPYQLVLGEPIIDIYYGDYEEALKRGNGGIHFEFTSGKYNAANYIVENNVDKGRLRLKIQGSSGDYLKVTSDKGLNYLQAGGVCFIPNYLQKGEDKNEDGKLGVDEISGDVQTPYYSIVGIHTVQLVFPGFEPMDHDKFVVEPALGNGYLVTDDTMLTNVSTYGTAYVFSKSNLNVNDAFKLSEIQKENINSLRINYNADGFFTFIDGTDLTQINQWEKFEYDMWAGDDSEPFEVDFEITGPVNVVYCFKGTNSEIHDADREVSPIEDLISKFGMSLIDKFVKVTKLGGDDGKYYVTIDSLVFNEYPNTIVDFWGDTNYLSGKSKPMINFWFNVFKAWAIVLYIILLIYIGIKTMIVSGTSEQKKVKSMFEGWLVGLLMLFCFPFLFKYLIEINDMVVDIVRTNSKYSVYAYYTFENMYTKWGQEDGENSTTSVIDSLRKAEKQLQEDISDNEEKIKSKLSLIENAEKEVEALENENIESLFEKYTINKNIDNTKTYLKDLLEKRNINLKKQEKNITLDDVDADLKDIINNFYNEEVNKNNFINSKDMETALNENKVLNNMLELYARSLLNGYDKDVVETIKVLGINIISREQFPLIAEKMKSDLEKQKEELEELEQDLEAVQYAIVKAQSNQADIMGEMRVRIDEGGKFLYVVILAIMVFEVILLLIIYYKRLFMIAILVTIFPLVTVAYVFERSRGENAKIVKTWMQEYLTNVFIQVIHAILYVTLVEVGYAVFIDNHDNVIIFIIAVTSLITAEPILKNILGLKSSTVTDLAKYGATMGQTLAATAAVTSTVIHTKKDLENIDKKAAKKESKISAKQEKHDKRLDVLRRANQNRINGNAKFTDAKKTWKLNKWNNFDASTDKAKESIRKKREAIRRRQKTAKKYGRVAANATAAFTTIAGSIAAGGDLEDFASTASVANAITGTGQEVSGDDNVKVENKVGDVSTENTNTPNGYVPKYSSSNYDYNSPENSGNGYYGQGYGSYGYNGSGQGYTGGGIESGTENGSGVNSANEPEIKTPQMTPRLRGLFSNRLEEEKIYVEKKYNEREEDRRN